MTTRQAVTLDSPVDHVILFVRLDPNGWRFDNWHPAVGYSLPEIPPPTTLGLSFPTPGAAAKFFTKVLTSPEDVVPPEPTRVPGRMPLAPECDFYWPPSLERCIERYEADLQAESKNQMPIRRVLILGAGFSAGFQFASSNTIVRGVAKFFEDEDWKSIPWYKNRYEEVKWWLDEYFPGWETDSPHLYEFLDSFFPSSNHRQLKRFIQASDPVSLHNQGISWEFGNEASWINECHHLPNEDTYHYLRSFEALMGAYLLMGRFQHEVRVDWVNELHQQIEPTDAILTFNWDVIPESIMVGVGKPFCRYDWTFERIKLIKLHGSVDLFGVPHSDMRGELYANRLRFECVTEKMWRARTSGDVLVRNSTFGRGMSPMERYN